MKSIILLRIFALFFVLSNINAQRVSSETSVLRRILDGYDKHTKPSTGNATNG